MTETKPRSFWGRVTEFVKNPTQDWALTRHAGALREQQELERVKAREEQRKLDAFIRKRELASLRRMRRRQAEGVPVDGMPSDVPETDGADVPAPAREATLHKINEIERAMSAPEARGSNRRARRATPTGAGDLAAEADAIRVRDAPPSEPDTQPLEAPPSGGSDLAFPLTDMHPRQPGASSPPSLLSHMALTALPTQPMAATDAGATELAPTRPAATQMAPTEPAGGTSGLASGASSGFVSSRRAVADAWGRVGPGAMAVDVQEGVSASPLFDQACIDFANGDDAAAERALLDAISGSPERELENEFWLALFDLYRAGGSQARFDALVTDYVDRFQTSAPSWGNPGAAPPLATAAAPQSAFTALGELDVNQARALLRLARSGTTEVALDFNALTAVGAEALPQALQALRILNARADCNIELGGVDNLVDACAVGAPPMQRDVDANWWSIRLEALRMAGRQEAFENVALSYCVTYEISPPTWEAPKARVRVLAGEFGAGDAAASTLLPLQGTSLFGTSQFHGSGFAATRSGLALGRLEGEIAGGSEAFLKPLDHALAGRDGVIVDMSELRRLDFSSAGIILNWVMTQTGAGHAVRLEGVHRLIAGLFVILGVNSVAQIELRRS